MLNWYMVLPYSSACTILLLFLLSPVPKAEPLPQRPPLQESSLSELEERIAEIDKKLENLSEYSLVSGVGPIGYRTQLHQESRTTEIVTVNWGHDASIDEIILVPTIHRAQLDLFQATGFPLEFKIICGSIQSTNETLIASFTEADQLQARLGPLVAPCPGTTAAWVRVEATLLSRDLRDRRYVLQLAELMVFSGYRNIALQSKVTGSPNSQKSAQWRSSCLVDGFTPYALYAGRGKRTPSVVSWPGEGDPATITIDLERPYPIDQIHLHTAEIYDTIPKMYDSRFGVPRRLVIEGSNRPDFSDKVQLLNFRQGSPFETGPIIMRNIPEQECRYIRLIARSPYFPDRQDESRSRFGFAEIELFSKGENVALGKPVSTNFKFGYGVFSPAPLTDGHNLYGRLLPLRDWMNELALRHDLEKERPLVAEELSRRYARQKNQLIWVIRLAVMLGISIVFGIFVEWTMRQRAVYRTRERIAADIHDELSANLHAIGLLGNLARMLKDSPDEQNDILVRLQAMAKRTGLAARYCTNFLESKELHEDIVEDMRRTTERLVADLEHEISFEGEDLIRQLKPRRRVDLFLFYKECLTNVIRHSGATRVSSRVQMTPKLLSLSITDNGRGADLKGDQKAPHSLRRRARLLGGSVSAITPEDGGTCIQLTRTIKKKDLTKRGSVV